MAKYKCEVCGSPSLEPLCWKHRAKKTIQKSAISTKEEVAEMLNLFLTLWDEQEIEINEGERGVFCRESGRFLKREKFRLLTTCYHHVLEKKSYPQYKLLKENIVILHPDMHQLAHQDINKTPRVKALREKLMSKHLNNELNEEEQVS